MASIYDDAVNQERSLSAKKLSTLLKSREKKRDLIKPGNDTNAFKVLDADTIQLASGEKLRVNMGEGRIFDAFETSNWSYNKRPDVEVAHKKAYAEYMGIPNWRNVSRSQLLEAGRNAKAVAKKNLEDGLKNGNLSFERTGDQTYDRTVVNVIDNRLKNNFGDIVQNARFNAGRNSKYNYQQRRDDLSSGKRANFLGERDTNRSALKRFGQDLPVNIVAGGIDTLAGLGFLADRFSPARTASTLANKVLGTPELPDYGTEALLKAQQFSSFLREKLGSDENAKLQNLRQNQNNENDATFTRLRDKALASGNSELGAFFKAGMNDFSNTIRNMRQRPADTIDSLLETVPSLFTAGVFGKLAAKGTAKAVSRKILKDQAAKRFAKNGTTVLTKEATEAGIKEGEDALAKYMVSEAGQKAMGRTTANKTALFVGQQEAVPAAAQVYGDIMRTDFGDLKANSEEYRKLIKEGNTPEEARSELATTAYMKTYGLTSILGTASSKLSGAAGFESKLFQGKTAIEKSTIAAPKKFLRKRTVPTAKQAKRQKRVDRYIKTPFKASKHFTGSTLKETLEEGSQSGGGEAISQYATQPVTGKKIGKGIGRATAEGAALGGLLGGGAHVVTGIPKALGVGAISANKLRKKLKAKNGYGKERKIANTTEAQLGGSAAVASSNVGKKQASPSYNPQNETTKSLNKILDNPTDPNVLDTSSFRELEAHYEAAKNSPEGVSKSVEDGFNGVKDIFQTNLKSDVQGMIDNTDKGAKLDNTDIAKLQEASKRNLIDMSKDEKAVFEAKYGKEATEALGHSNKVNTLLNKAQKAGAARVANAPEGTRKTVAEVEQAKLGNTKGPKGRGLGAYVNEMSEAIANNNIGTFLGLNKSLSKFIKSQSDKINELRTIVDSKGEIIPEGSKYKYTDSLPKLLAGIEQEQKTMLAIQQGLGQQYAAWNGNKKLDTHKLSAAQQAALQKESVNAKIQGLNSPVGSSTNENTGENTSKGTETLPDTETAQNSDSNAPEGHIDPDAGTAQETPQPNPQETAQETGQNNPQQLGIDETGGGNPDGNPDTNSNTAPDNGAENTPEGTINDTANTEQPTVDKTTNTADETKVEENNRKWHNSEKRLANIDDTIKSVEKQAGNEDTEPDVLLENEFDNSTYQAKRAANKDPGTTPEVTLAQMRSDLIQKRAEQGITEPVVSDNTNTDNTTNTSEEQKAKNDADLNTAIEGAKILLKNNKKGVKNKSLKDRWGNFVKGITEIHREYWSKVVSSDVNLKDFGELVGNHFRIAKLPFSGNEIFEIKNNDASSLASVVPNLMNLLQDKKNRATFYKALDFNADTELAMDHFVRFYGEFKGELENIVYNFTEMAEDPNMDNKYLLDRLRESPFFYLEQEIDGVRVLDPAIVTAAALESYSWISSTGSRTLFNDPKDINALLARSKDITPKKEENFVLQKSGIPMLNVVNSMGNSIFKHLNIKIKKQLGEGVKVDSLFAQRLSVSLGGMSMLVMQQMGVVEMNKVSSGWLASRVKTSEYGNPDARQESDLESLYGENIQDAANVDLDVLFVRAISQERDPNTRSTNTSDLQVSHKNLVISKMYKKLQKPFSDLFGATPKYRNPSFEPVAKEDVPQNIKNSVMRAPKVIYDVMVRMGTQPFQAHNPMFKLALRMDKNTFLENFTKWRSAEDIANNVHITNKTSAEGLNAQLEREYDFAMDHYKKNRSRKIYFPWHAVKTDRMYIDSNTINPVQSKMHRYMFGMSAWKHNVSTDITSESFQNFIMGMGEAFGISPASVLRKDVLTQVAELMNTPEMVAALDLMLNSEKALEDFTTAELAILKPVADINRLQSVNALMDYASYVKAKKAGEVAFKVEGMMAVDGIANGATSGAAQTIGSDIGMSKKSLNQGGVYFIGDKAKNFPEFKADGGLDAYEDTSDVMHTDLNNMPTSNDAETISKLRDIANNSGKPEDAAKLLEALIQEKAADVTGVGFLPTLDDLVEDIGRDLAKNPLMIAAYGAAIKNIRKSLIEDSVEGWYSRLAESQTIEEIHRVFTQAINLANIAIRAHNDIVNSTGEGTLKPIRTTPKNLEEMRGFMRKVTKASAKVNDAEVMRLFKTGYTLHKDTETEIKQSVDSTYGASLEKALVERTHSMEEFRSMLNQANYLMNAQFAEYFAVRLKQREALNGGDRVGKAEIQELMEEFLAEGLLPSIATPHSTKNQLSTEMASYKMKPTLVGAADESKAAKGKQAPRNVARVRFKEAVQVVNNIYSKTGKLSNGQKQKSFAMALELSLPSLDVGVSAVVNAMHGIDSFTAARTALEHAMLNVHDSAGTNMQEAINAAKISNESWYRAAVEFDLGQAVLKSLLRLSQLTADTDGRLTSDQKENVYKQMTLKLKKFNTPGYNKNNSNKENVNAFVAELQKAVKNNTQDRLELLSTISHVNQFGIQGGEYVVTDEDRKSATETLDIRPPYLSDPHDTLSEAAEAYKQWAISDIRKAHASVKQEYVNTIADRLGNENVTIEEINREIVNLLDTLNGYDGGRVLVRDILDVIQSAYNLAATKSKKPASVAAINKIINAILPNLTSPHENALAEITMGTLPGIDPITGESENSAQYTAGNHTITLDRNSTSTNRIRDILHEAIHASNYLKLIEMSRSDPKTFQDLVVAAKIFGEYAKAEGARTGDVALQQIGEVILEQLNKDPARAISEYHAYALTHGIAIPNKANSRYFSNKKMQQILSAKTTLDDGTGVKTDTTLFQGYMESVANPKTGEVGLRNSTDTRTESLVDESNTAELTADTMKGFFNKWAKQGKAPTNPEHRGMLDRLINTFLVPGIQSIQPIMQNISKNPNGMRNIGEAVVDKIFLEEITGDNKSTSNVDMTLAEVAAHEYSHVILKAVLNGNIHIRKEVRRLYNQAKENITPEDFKPEEGIVGNTAEGERQAKERYDHIFNNEAGDNLHEFMAIALTNYQFALALSKIDNKETRKPIWSAGILQGILNLFSRGVQWLSNQEYDSGSGNLASGVNAMAMSILAINQKHNIIENHEATWASVADSANDVVKAVFNKALDPLRKYTTKKSREFYRDNQQELNGRSPTLKEQGTMLTSAGLDATQEGFLESFNDTLSEMDVAKDSAIYEMLSEVMPMFDNNLDWMELLTKAKSMIDATRKRIEEHTKLLIKDSFLNFDNLTSHQRKAINSVVIRLDLGSLLDNNNKNNLADMHQLLQSKTATLGHIESTGQRIAAVLDAEGASEITGLVLAQATSLGNKLVEKSTMRMGMKNAYGIAKQHMLNPNDRVQLSDTAFEEVKALIDQYATLVGITETPQNTLDLALQVFDKEMSRTVPMNGFVQTVAMSENFKTIAQKKLFDGSPHRMIKGYVYENYDPDVGIATATNSPEDVKAMKRRGYKPVTDLPSDPFDANNVQHVLYSGFSSLAPYSAGIISMTEIGTRGSSVFQPIEDARREMTAKQATNISKQRMHKYTQRAYAEMRSYKGKSLSQIQKANKGDYTYATPLVKEDGSIYEYSYLMSESTKTRVLKPISTIENTLPRMFASIADRNNTDKVNAESAKLMYKEYIKYRNSDKHNFIEISSTSKSKAGREMYALMPSKTRKEFKRLFGGETFYLRDEMANTVLGYRQLTIAHEKYFGKATFAVKLAEDLWKDVIKVLKLHIVVQPSVVVGNLASNIALLLSQNIPPTYIAKNMYEAVSALKQYKVDIAKRDKLVRTIGANKALGNIKLVNKQMREMRYMEQNLLNNPVHEMIKGGMFTGIVEDHTINERSLARKLGTALNDNFGNDVTRGIAKLGQNILMLPGSESTNVVMAATQYGDFVARYTKYKYDTQVLKVDPVKAKWDSLNQFIYYDKLQNKNLAYAESIGLIMFTRFWARIQPTIVNLTKGHPASSTGVLLAQLAFTGGSFDDNIFQYGGMQGVSGKVNWNIAGNVTKFDWYNSSLFNWVLNPLGMSTGAYG